MRPILRYHGGKWMLADWIISKFPKHTVYVEPFGGAGSVLLKKPRSYSEVYNDMDGEIVNVFRVFRNFGSELIEKLNLTPYSRKEFDLAYMPATGEVERAMRTIIKSFMGFGSNGIHRPTGFRSCSNRSGTTPAHDWANYPNKAQFFIDRLRGVVLESKGAAEIIKQHDGPGTLHYLDPPYLHETRSDKNHDYRFELTEADHRNLSCFLENREGMVVLSGYDSEMYRDIYGGWKMVSRAALADGARPRVECLWLNRACQNALSQMELFVA